jgi:protein HOOK3
LKQEQTVRFLCPYVKFFKADKTTVAAIDKDEIDRLEDLKTTNEIVTSSFQKDLLILQSKHKALTTDFEQQKTQLIDALLSKDKLMKDIASFKEPTGTNGDNAYQKAQSKAINQDENAQKALQDVSAANSTPDTEERKSPGKTRRFLKAFSRLAFHPYPIKLELLGLSPCQNQMKQHSIL